MNKISIIGFGCVGLGLHKILQEKYPEITVDKIIVKNKSKTREQGLPYSFDVDEVLYNSKSHIIIEVIDDATAAFEYAKIILSQGRTLITANKKMVAENLPELKRLVIEYGGKLFYEGAVCGSIPIIQNFRNYYTHEKVKSIKGILNGSTNYILTLMSIQGISYQEALVDAQAKGFAETDPTLDVEGIDAANKLSILCSEAFRRYISPGNIPVSGISKIDAETLIKAQKENKKIKLIAYAALKDNQLITKVGPELIDAQHPLYNIDNEFNSILIEGEFAGVQQLTGKGAGSLPTGMAVASDVLKACINNTSFLNTSTLKAFATGQLLN